MQWSVEVVNLVRGSSKIKGWDTLLHWISECSAILRKTSARLNGFCSVM